MGRGRNQVEDLLEGAVALRDDPKAAIEHRIRAHDSVRCGGKTCWTCSEYILELGMCGSNKKAPREWRALHIVYHRDPMPPWNRSPDCPGWSLRDTVPPTVEFE